MPTLRDTRRWLARSKIRRYRQITAGVQATSPNGAYVGVAAGDLTTNGDNQRAIVSSDLASLSLSAGDDVRSDLYDGWYAYLLTAEIEQRRISLDGYTPHAEALSVTDQASSSVQVGYLVTERNLRAVVPAGTVVEFHAHPPMDADGAPGLHFFINQALKGMRGMTRRISISGLATQQAYSLAAYGITRQWQLAQVLGHNFTSGLEPYTSYGAAQLRTDGNITYLVFTGGAPITGTFYVDLYLPRDSWILSKRTAAAMATATSGAITAITLLDAGVGYDAAPTVTISGAGTGATATATVANGVVTGFTITAAGSGYATATTTVTLSEPTSTTFAVSTTGLVNDLDECTGDINEIAIIAYYHYCMYRAEGVNGFDQEWEKRAAKAAAIAAPFLQHGSDMPIDAWNGGRTLVEQGGAGSDWGILR